MRTSAWPLLWLICACLAPWGGALPAETPKTGPELREETRPLWTRPRSGFIRDWLVCGEFPNPPAAEALFDPWAEYYAPTRPSLGFENDYLQAQGGETRIRPKDGLTHRRPDGTTATWSAYASPGDVIDFKRAFPNRPGEQVVGYAFALLHRARAGRAVLAVGSDDGVKIWLNGKLIHDKYVERPVRADSDLIDVYLQAGDNALLVKVAQHTGGWGFCLRTLELAEALALGKVVNALDPIIEVPKEGEPLAGHLVVTTDGPREGPNPRVHVQIVQPGGTILTEASVPRGARAVFAPARWPDGPYEIRCLADGSDDKPIVRHLSWFKGDGLPLLRTLLTTVPPPADTSPEALTHRFLAEVATDRVGTDLAKVNAEAIAGLANLLMEFVELQQARRGLPGGAHPFGCVRLAYLDEVDGSAQFGRAYLPAGYTPDKAWPLVIVLHGYDYGFPPYKQWGGVLNRHDGFAERYGAITVYPHGRGNNWYRGMADRDVMTCLTLAMQRFTVDPDRVYIMGASMGGAGTWNVASRHPECFAALAPTFGGYDFRFQIDDAALAATTPRIRARLERLSCFAQLEALLNLPILVNHGDADPVVVVGYSRFAVKMLQRWGYNLRYWEHPERGHGGLGNENDVADWLLSHRRNPAPRHVRLRAIELKSAAAHWVRVEQRDDPYAFIQVDAEIIAANTIRLDTDHVLAITLTPPEPFVQPYEPLYICWNGEEAREVELQDGAVTLYARGYTPAPDVLQKRPALEGPISDATNTPFVVVAGTISLDPLMRAFCEVRAQELSDQWYARYKVRPRSCTDTALTPEQRARYSLLLVGGPAENLVTQQLAEKIPLTVTPTSITIDGRKFMARDAAARMVYPHPENADRYVVVLAATSPAGMYLSYPAWPDADYWILEGHRPNADAGRLWEPVRHVLGYFDHTWRYKEAYTEIADPERPIPLPMRTAPTRASALTVTEPRLALSDVLERSAEGSLRFAMRNANWDGGPLTLDGKTYASGLSAGAWGGISSISYDLTGVGWSRLRSVIGLETERRKTTQQDRQSVGVYFVVKGDGEELFRSKAFNWTSGAQAIDVNIAGVDTLTLEIHTGTSSPAALRSVDWADLRLVR